MNLVEITDKKDASRIDPNFRNDEGLLSSELLFSHTDNDQDALLFECVTPIRVHHTEKKQIAPDGKASSNLTKPERSATVFTWKQFSVIWDTLQSDQKEVSKIHRVYWLGDSWNGRVINPKLVSDFLVQSLAERVKRYREDIPIHLLQPFSPSLYAKSPQSYEISIGYREWLHRTKAGARYDLEVINSFVNNKNIDSIVDFGFGVQTDVLTDEEIERIYTEIKKNPEPKLEYRPANYKREEKTATDLTTAVQKLVEIQTEQLIKTNTKKETKKDG